MTAEYNQNIYSAVPRTVRQLLDAGARLYANKSALIFPDSGMALSYAQLQKRVQAVTSALTSHGLNKGSKIAIHLPNGPDFIDVFLGAMYGGFIAVPFDYQCGRETANFVLQHCNPDLLVTDTRTHEYNIRVAHAKDLIGKPCSDTIAQVSPEDHALINYTSGTTDNPKAVLLGHSQLAANTIVHQQMHSLTADDITMLVMPLHHLNPQGVSLISTLYSGGTVVIPETFRLRDFIDHVRRYKCTWIALVPAMIEQLLMFSDSNPELDWKLTGLRFVRSSSAPLSDTAQKKFEQRFNVPVIQAMGSTEAGSTFFCNPLPPGVRKDGSVGLPVIFKARVVNENGESLPNNEVGAIQVLSDTLMLGYYKNEKATNNQFSEDGWLFTGDMGYRDDDGYYFIIGRRVDVVNRGGEKISLSEVDSILLEHPQVLEGVAIAVPDVIYGEQLVAFVVLKANERFVESDLLLYCSGKLGAMRAPVSIFEIEAIPRTSTMKVMRRVLVQKAEKLLANQLHDLSNPAKAINQHKLSEKPANVTERLVADMFAKVLNLEVTDIVRDDNFFYLGGSSLDAIQLLVMMNERNLGKIPARLLFENPTVQDIAKYIEAANNDMSADISTLVCLNSSGDQPPLFFIPGGGGDDNIIFFHYGKLINHMDKENPIYAFRAHGTKGEETSLQGSVESIASEYINDMKQKHPRGPYYIVGYCIGGLVAYEMAQQLVRAGDEVASLVLVDTRHPGSKRVIDKLNEKTIKMKKSAMRFDSFIGRKLWQRVVFHLQAIKELPVEERSEYLFSKLGQLKAFYLHSTKIYAHTHTDIRVAKKIAESKKHYQQVLSKYLPEPYPGKLSVIVSNDLSQRESPWRNINPGRVQTYIVPGDHGSHINEHTKEVALALTKCLKPD